MCGNTKYSKELHEKVFTSNDGIDVIEEEENLDKGGIVRRVLPVEFTRDNDDEQVENNKDASNFLYFYGFIEIEFCNFAVLQRTCLRLLLSEFNHSLLFAQDAEKGVKVAIFHLTIILNFHFLFLLYLFL